MEINKKNTEDANLRKSLDQLLLNRRGYTFQMPKHGKSVASFFSGGLDSVVVTAYLLNKYKLKVFPFHFYRHLPHSPQTLKTCKLQYEELSKKFPTLLQPLTIIDLYYPSPTNHWVHQLDLQREFPPFTPWRWPDSGGPKKIGVPFSQQEYVFQTITDLLLAKSDPGVRTIFGSSLEENRRGYAFESITAARMITLEICFSTNDWRWQFTQLPMEPELALDFSKEKLIEIGTKMGLKLDQTWTCSRDLRYQCGMCDLCILRKDAFARSKIKDPTIYESERQDFRGKIKIGLGTKYHLTNKFSCLLRKYL